MENIPKIIAMYLPQFHCIPENDEFWGKGFTDWVTVKKAQPLFKGHQQPRVPQNKNYYDLSIKAHVAWQARLAKDYGIYGFGIYHYWFNNEKNLLTKPSEIILENKDIDTHFFFAWDNVSWKRSWSNVSGANDWAPIMDQQKTGPSILIPYVLGEEKDWINHYHHLLPYFQDQRYMKKDGKPVFIILHYSPEIAKMCHCWNELAKKDGFDGVFFIFFNEKDTPASEYTFKYEPSFSCFAYDSLSDRLMHKVKSLLSIGGEMVVRDYDKAWKRILKNASSMPHETFYHGAVVSFDDTPRRGRKARILKNSTPQKFENYLLELMKITASQHKDYIFLTAWNEWGEGAYLEPDEITGMRYLQAIKNAQDRILRLV